MAKVQEQLLYNVDVVKPRSLTRAENKQFRKSGFHPNYPVEGKKPAIDDMADYLLENFFSNINFDAVANSEVVKFVSEVIAMTYGQGTEETKN